MVNRKQRREAAKEHIEMVDLRQVTMLWQLSPKECFQMAMWRINDNLKTTKHPTHHLTANGVIVDADPTLEFLIARLEREAPAFHGVVDEYIKLHLRSAADAPKAVPVNRTYYGHDPYAERKA